METMQGIKTFASASESEPRQHSLSTVDGQMRRRTKSDLIGSRASAGRCTFEVLRTDVLLTGFDHERQCSNPCPIC